MSPMLTDNHVPLTTPTSACVSSRCRDTSSGNVILYVHMGRACGRTLAREYTATNYHHHHHHHHHATTTTALTTTTLYHNRHRRHQHHRWSSRWWWWRSWWPTHTYTLATALTASTARSTAGIATRVRTCRTRVRAYVPWYVHVYLVPLVPVRCDIPW